MWAIWIYLHIKSETHPSVKVTDEHLDHIFDEAVISNQPVAFQVKHLKKSIIDYSWKIAVLNECDFVQFLLLNRVSRQTSQSEVLVQIFEVGVEVVFDELGVSSEDVEILHLDIALHLLWEYALSVITDKN